MVRMAILVHTAITTSTRMVRLGLMGLMGLITGPRMAHPDIMDHRDGGVGLHHRRRESELPIAKAID
jgi:hypothetical protein